MMSTTPGGGPRKLSGKAAKKAKIAKQVSEEGHRSSAAHPPRSHIAQGYGPPHHHHLHHHHHHHPPLQRQGSQTTGLKVSGTPKGEHEVRVEEASRQGKKVAMVRGMECNVDDRKAILKTEAQGPRGWPAAGRTTPRRRQGSSKSRAATPTAS